MGTLERRPLATAAGHQHGRRPQGVIVGDFVFFSAVRGTDPMTGEAPADPARQARHALGNVLDVLRELGSGPQDVVRVGIFMKDLHRHRPIFDQEWTAVFGDDAPARFAVQVSDFGGEDDESLFLLDVVALARAQERADPAVTPSP